MYKEKIINIVTGEESFRDYTAEEIAEVKKAQEESKAYLEASKLRQQQRESALAKLVDLGLTEEEIAAL